MTRFREGLDQYLPSLRRYVETGSGSPFWA
jgi:hypothetical protein